MELNVNVKIDLGERTAKVVEDFVGTVMALRTGVVMVAEPHAPEGPVMEAPKNEEAPAEQKPNLEEPKKPSLPKKKKAEAEEPKLGKQVDETPETPSAGASVMEAPEPLDDAPSVPELQPKDIRDAMERIREKFGDITKDGEQVNPQLHRSLTRSFKAIANAMGYEKPSAIDTPAKRWEFLGALDGIYIGEDGQAMSY